MEMSAAALWRQYYDYYLSQDHDTRAQFLHQLQCAIIAAVGKEIPKVTLC